MARDVSAFFNGYANATQTALAIRFVAEGLRDGSATDELKEQVCAVHTALGGIAAFVPGAPDSGPRSNTTVAESAEVESACDVYTMAYAENPPLAALSGRRADAVALDPATIVMFIQMASQLFEMIKKWRNK